MLVGTRGAGKTMLLRRLRHTHPGLAVYGDLRKILNAISNDTGAAGLTFDEISPSLEHAIRAKAVALLAYWLADQLRDRGLSLPLPSLRLTLPRALRSQAPSDSSIVDWLGENLYFADLDSFADGPPSQALIDLASAIATAASGSQDAPLLLLLDRAEEVVYPALTPILQLLDQSHPFLAVVATRPGLVGPDSLAQAGAPIPGDHYDIRHLGAAPYSAEWQQFQRAVLEGWVPCSLDKIPAAELALVQRVTRDAIRSTLEVVYESVGDAGTYEKGRAITAISRIKEMLIDAAQGQLHHLNDDLRGLFRKIRKADRKFKLPIMLRLGGARQHYLLGAARPFHDMSRDEKFVALGLRTGILTTCDGVGWHPYRPLDSVEIHPLVIWEENDPWYDIPYTS